jgi:hypothetical protein
MNNLLVEAAYSLKDTLSLLWGWQRREPGSSSGDPHILIDWMFHRKQPHATDVCMQWRPICERTALTAAHPGPGAQCADCGTAQLAPAPAADHSQLKTYLSFELRANHCNAAADRKASTHDARHGRGRGLAGDVSRRAS